MQFWHNNSGHTLFFLLLLSLDALIGIKNNILHAYPAVCMKEPASGFFYAVKDCCWTNSRSCICLLWFTIATVICHLNKLQAKICKMNKQTNKKNKMADKFSYPSFFCWLYLIQRTTRGRYCLTDWARFRTWTLTDNSKQTQTKSHDWIQTLWRHQQEQERQHLKYTSFFISRVKTSYRKKIYIINAIYKVDVEMLLSSFLLSAWNELSVC